MISLLNLPSAKKIPSAEFKRCTQVRDGMNVFFTLQINDKEYSLTHCSGKYEYSLNLTATQKTAYKKLRAKLGSLFNDLPNKSGVG